MLGFGASVYDTYQNCPRLSDKLMEECGSRRLAQRQELDDGAEDDDAKTAKFEGDVLKVLKSLPNATTAPVCAWTKPDSKILEKSEADLNLENFEVGGGAAGMVVVGVLGVAVAVGYYGYSNGWF